MIRRLEGWSAVGKYGQWNGGVRVWVLGHEAGRLRQGGSRGPDAQGWMQDLEPGVLKVGLSHRE